MVTDPPAAGIVAAEIDEVLKSTLTAAESPDEQLDATTEVTIHIKSNSFGPKSSHPLMIGSAVDHPLGPCMVQ